MNYQAVARNTAGQALASQTIKVRLSVNENGGATFYTETRSITTNALGRFNVQIGSAGATATSGSLSATYSVVQLVNGANSKLVTPKAWPVPAVSPLFVQVSGRPREVLLVYDNSGRLVKQLPVANNQVVQLSGLTADIYTIRLQNGADVMRKIVVQ